jgi:large subunit ribosomal protein L16
MGSGKGAPDYWVAVVQPGKIIYEMKGIPETIARQALRIAAYKMPIKTAFRTVTGMAQVAPKR